MNGRKGLELTEAQQLLLCRYLDKECSCVGRFRARRLLMGNCEAKRYLAELAEAGACCRDAHQHETISCDDLWARVEARIVAEERAALYLGERSGAVDEQREQSLWQRFSGSQVLFGGLSGAAVTAVALFIATTPTDPSNLSAQYPTVARNATQSGATGFTQVGTQSQQSRPVLLNNNRGGASALEVDWMRANGPLRFIQNPEERSAIIWVMRRNRNEPFPKRSTLEATPTAPIGLSQSIDSSFLPQQR